MNNQSLFTFSLSPKVGLHQMTMLDKTSNTVCHSRAIVYKHAGLLYP